MSETDALRRNALDSNDLRAWQSLADRLERENAELRKRLAAVQEQAEQGIFIEHKCPAFYACCAIVAECATEHAALSRADEPEER